MKALSWRQPYGSLMLHGKIETRVWNTEYRGPVLICTSKRAYTIDVIQEISGGQDGLLRIIDELKGDITLPDGHAIAFGNLVDCRPMIKADEEKAFVKYRPSLYSHIYEDVLQLVKPFPVTGRQRWFNVDISPGQLDFILNDEGGPL